MRLTACLLGAALGAGAQLRPVAVIPLAGVEGRIDHLACDAAGGRLFVAALGNNTVEVIDLAAGRRVRSLTGFAEPQGVAYLAQGPRLYVANGGDGRVTVLDGATLARMADIAWEGDADNLRYDAGAGRVWVGYGAGALGEMDAASGRRLGEVKLAAHPESFQLERGSERLYVNVPQAGHVAVVDRRRRTVLAHWPVPGAAANYPMALDEENHRLFIGCRKPAEVLVYNTDTGKVTTRFACPGDTDDLFCDAARQRLYISGGDGTLAIVRQTGPDRYERAGTIRTGAGARTCLFVPASGRLYLAVPHRGTQRAEVRVFQTE